MFLSCHIRVQSETCTVIGPYPFDAPSGLHWVPMWQLFPLHQKAVAQPSTPDVFNSDTPSNKSFEQGEACTTKRKEKKKYT